MKAVHIILNQGFYGAERVVYNLSKGLISAKIEIVVVTSPELKEKFSELGVSRIYTLSSDSQNSLPKRAFRYFKWIIKLRAILRAEKPDLVHVHGNLPSILMIVLNPSCPVIETLHGQGIQKDEQGQKIIQRVTDPFAALAAEGNIFYMRAIIEKYSRLRLLRPTAVIYNPVDEDFIRMVSTPADPPIKGKYILWCGRLSRIKGAHLLVRAFALLHRADVSLVLIGDGPDREMLENLAKSLGIQESTVFLGFVDGTRKAQFFQHASIICANLANPELSQVVLEGVSTGHPVVTAFSSEVYEVFGPYISLLKTQSVDGLASILATKLDTVQDPVGGPQIIQERFSLSRFTQQHLLFYEQVLAARKNAHR